MFCREDIYIKVVGFFFLLIYGILRVLLSYLFSTDRKIVVAQYG